MEKLKEVTFSTKVADTKLSCSHVQKLKYQFLYSCLIDHMDALKKSVMGSPGPLPWSPAVELHPPAVSEAFIFKPMALLICNLVSTVREMQPLL